MIMKKVRSVRISERTDDELRRMALRKKKSISELVEETIKRALARG